MLCIGVLLTGVAVGAMIHDGPDWRLVVGALGGLALVALNWPVTTTKVEPTTAPPPAAPGLRKKAIANARTCSTELLIARHNEGAQLGFVPDVMAAIEIVLKERGVSLCSCGAPLPDGIHKTACQEVRP